MRIIKLRVPSFSVQNDILYRLNSELPQFSNKAYEKAIGPMIKDLEIGILASVSING